MKNKCLYLFFVLYLSINVARGQGIDTFYIASYDANTELYRFKHSILAEDMSFPAGCLKIHADLSLVYDKTTTDAVGGTHRHYYHASEGVPILNSEFIVHLSPDGNATHANGHLITSFGLGNSVNISAEDALAAAIAMDGGSNYAWDDANVEDQLKSLKNDVDATWYPQPKLMIMNIYMADPDVDPVYRYVYKMDLYRLAPHDNNCYYIDAFNAYLQLKQSNISTCFKPDANSKKRALYPQNKPAQTKAAYLPPPCPLDQCDIGSANTIYYGAQSLNLYRPNTSGTCYWYLSNYCALGLAANSYLTADDYATPNPWTRNTSPTWGSTQQEATSALHCLTAVSDYYYNVGRSSIDDLGSGVSISVNNGSFINTSPAYMAPGYIYVPPVPAGPFIADMTTIEIIGHEYTHGVTNPPLGTIVSMETAAIAEALPDMMGVLASGFWSSWGAEDWLLASECTSGGLRDMAFPNTFNDPDTYLGTYWTTNGSLSPHELGGVLNYWFYLLCEGGNGTNDLSNPYCVEGITRMHAGAIVYHYIKNYLAPNETFASMRAKTIQSSIDLYGAPDTYQTRAVTSAWHAVGVGPAFSGWVRVGGLVTGTETWAYNNPVHVPQILIVSNTANLTITSGDQVLFEDTEVQTGANLLAYITPGCAGGARQGTPGAASNGKDTGAATAENVTPFDFAVIPNPNNGQFKLTLNSDGQLPSSILILDVMGRTVKEIRQPQSYALDVDLQNQANGIYLIRANFDETFSVKRVVKN